MEKKSLFRPTVPEGKVSLHGGKALEQAEAQKAKRSHHQLQTKRRSKPQIPSKPVSSVALPPARLP